MNVPNVFSGLSDLASRFTSAMSDTKAAAAKTAVAPSPSPLTLTAAMRDVVSQYDMTDITPSDFSKLVQQLTEKGAISQKDAQELSSVRVDLENAGVNGDDSVNLLGFYQQQIAKAQAAAAASPKSAAAKAGLAALTGRLNWLQKFAAVGREGSSSGVNAVA